MARWRGVAAQSEVSAKPRRTHGTSLISAEPRILQTDVDWRSAAAARWPEDALCAEIADELDAGEANDDAMRLDQRLLQERYPEQLVKGRIDEDWRMSEKKEVAMALRGEEDGLTTTLAAEEEGERRRTRMKRNDRDETNEVAKLASESTEPRRGLREDGAWFSHDLDIGKPDPPT